MAIFTNCDYHNRNQVQPAPKILLQPAGNNPVAVSLDELVAALQTPAGLTSRLLAADSTLSDTLPGTPVKLAGFATDRFADNSSFTQNPHVHTNLTALVFEIANPNVARKIRTLKMLNYVLPAEQLTPWDCHFFRTVNGYGLLIPLKYCYPVAYGCECFTRLIADTAKITQQLATFSPCFLNPDSITPKYLQLTDSSRQNLEIDSQQKGFTSLTGERLQLPLTA